jgi:SNF2 family DNA or RNA helicase
MTPSWPLETIQPRDVQLEAFQAGYGKPGFCYFMRQRLGKTYLAIAEYEALRKEGKVDWMVVICPNSLKGAWAESVEQANFFLPVHTYASQKKEAALHFFRTAKFGVFIINFESANSFVKNGTHLRFNLSRTYIVADESTKIKDYKAVSTKAAHTLSDGCAYSRILTGRPKANNNSDLWAQLRFAKATKRNYFSFKHTFCVMGGFQGRQVVRDINDDILKEEMSPFCYIAPDKYVKGFEKIYDPIRHVDLPEDLNKLYRQMHDALVIELNDEKAITAPIALTKYLRLQQISSGIAGDEDKEQHNLIEPSKNPKIKELCSILETDVTGKVIIVCRFRLSIKNISGILTEKGIQSVQLVGNMSAEEIDRTKKTFNESTDVNVLIAQEQVLSYGHTLVGNSTHPCDSVIFYENSFSLLNRIQAESRPEQYGRDIPITYYDIATSPMDRYIIKALVKKEDASLALMDYARKHGIRSKEVKVDELEGMF